MSYLKSGFLFIGSLVFLLSCQEQIGNAPEIEFITPTASQTEIVAEAFFVDIDIKDDIEVESYTFSLTSESGFELFADSRSIHKPYHKVSYSFDLQSDFDQSFDILIIVKDNDGNETQRSMFVTLDK